MILVDTSVWIRFLGNREPYASGLDDLLTRDEVFGHELIFGELLIGARGGRTRLLQSYSQMEHLGAVPHEEVVAFVRARRLEGRGMGWIDAHLLAAAVVAGCRFWTADERLAEAAHRLGVGHD